MFISKEWLVMSEVKNKIFGAVTVMSEKDADILWRIIIEKFSGWSDIEEIEPDETDYAMIDEISKNAECRTYVSSFELLKELGGV